MVLSLEVFQKIAHKRGGKCLTKVYSKASEKMKWKCSEGHVWEATGVNVKNRNSWCPKCNTGKKYTIEKINRIIKKRGGRCLSKEYIKANRKLLFKCKNGHEWEALLSNIISGRWCPECFGTKRLTIEAMQVVARKKKGKCLSKRYYNNVKPLLWECEEGHRWKSPAVIVKAGVWCRKCLLAKKKRN